MFGSGSLFLFSGCETDCIIKDQTEPFFFYLYDPCFTNSCAADQNFWMPFRQAPDRSLPVKRFDALKLGLNSTFRIKAGPGITCTRLYKKPFLHAKGEKIREGGFKITLKELLQSQQPWPLVATAAAETWMYCHGSGASEVWPALLSSLVRAVNLIKWSKLA